MAYTSKIHFALAVIVLIFTNGIFKTQSRTESEEDLCLGCTLKINNTLLGMKDLLRDRDTILLNTPEPCTPCIFTGILSVKLNGEVMPVKAEGTEDTCYDHVLKLKYDVIKVKCNCTLPINPQDVAQMIIEKSKNPTQGTDCAQGGPPPMDEQTMKEEMKNMAKIDPTTIMKMKECRPSVPKSLPFGMKEQESVTGGIEGTYNIFQFAVTLRACLNSPEVKATRVLRDRSVGGTFGVECVATVDKDFMEPCNCFAKTDFMDNTVSSAVTMLVPCMGGEKFDEDKEFINEMVCKDLLE